jgi:hypothetical protein
MFAWTDARVLPLAVSLALLGLFAVADADPVGEKVAKARVVYEKQMEEVRERVRSVLDKQEEQLRRRAKSDDQALASLAADRAAFETTGQWPSSTSAAVRQQQERAWTVLDRAYEDAESIYARTKRPQLEAAIRAERAALPKEEDLAAWGPELAGQANQPVGPGAALVLDSLPAPPYRVEVAARLIHGNGPLIIDCPLGGGKSLPVFAAASEGGELRAMLTVRATTVSADLGVERPVDLARAVADPVGRLTLRSEGAKFSIESVRVKTLQSTGQAPAAAPVSSPAARAPTSTGAGGQPMSVGSKWRGLFGGQTFDSIQICEVTVTSRSDRAMEFLLEYEGVRMTWSFAVTGNNLRLSSVTGTQPPALNVKGTGEIADQTISIDWEWTRQGHAKAEKGTLQLMSHDMLPQPPGSPTK